MTNTKWKKMFLIYSCANKNVEKFLNYSLKPKLQNEIVMILQMWGTLVWGWHLCCQYVPVMLQDVPSSDVDVMEHCTHCDDIKSKGVIHFQGFKEDLSPPCIHHALSIIDCALAWWALEHTSTLPLTGSWYGVRRLTGAVRHGYPLTMK